MIPLKDYYNILGVETSATIPEIRKAYRKLAMQYHPDKTDQDPYATAQFTAVKEAYEVLTHPLKKEWYLQQRWYRQSLGKKKTAEPLTPISLLKQILELDKYVSRQDSMRMDREGLFQYVQEILPSDTIKTINSFREPEVNKEIVLLLIRISRVLSYRQFAALAPKLEELSDQQTIKHLIIEQLKHLRYNLYWEKYKPYLLLLVAIAICLLIVLLSR